MTESEMLGQIASLSASNQELTDMLNGTRIQLDRHVRIVGLIAERHPNIVSDAYQAVKVIEQQ